MTTWQMFPFTGADFQYTT